jgi:Rv2175c C-terminal domain of unknown function
VNDTLDPGLDDLVGEWLTLPDAAEALGLDVGKVRRLVAERHLVGTKRGERATFQVPAAFLVPRDSSRAESDDRPGELEVLQALRGTVLVLGDAGFSDREILRWLFDVDDSIGAAPVEALRAGRKAEVRRVAQSLA